MKMSDLRKLRVVPAKRGMRVTVDGMPGVITSADCCAHIRVRFDGRKFTLPCHPCWRVVYHTPEGDVAVGCEVTL